ncbi:SH3 domain-containing protein [Streptomyces sp. NPDC059740]|uniref:SH3 domain-containing protein n=1 Tax=Streptomyces sp. NPDC059740 TaxID=3346926 RepID=UPI0036693E82
MSVHSKLLSGGLSRTAATVATALALGGTLFTSGPAQAAAPHQPYGTVTARTGVNERMYPSTDSSVRGTLPYQATVGLRCKVRAQNINGNTVWYLLRDRNTWVSAAYVANHGQVPYCNQVQRYENNNRPGGADSHAMG